MFKYVIGFWITAGLLMGVFSPEAVDLRATPIAYFHVPMAVSMLACFVIAAVYGGMWLKSRKEKHDFLSLGFAEAGFVAGLAAMATGIIFSRANWGRFWSWDPQQVGVLATLLTYSALFALRSATDDDRKKRDFWAVYAIIGALIAVFGGYIYRKILPPNTSLHPDNTLTKSSSWFTITLWFNVVGYLLLMTHIALMRAKLENALCRWRELGWKEDSI